MGGYGFRDNWPLYVVMAIPGILGIIAILAAVFGLGWLARGLR